MINVWMILTSIVFLQNISSIKGQCLPSQFECDNGNCIDSVDLCNYVDDCGDNSDERRHVTGFKCAMGRLGNVCVLPQRLVNNSVVECYDDSDQCVINGTNRCHKCLTVDMVLASSQLCDGVVDCPDLSDECLCETTDSQFLCEQLKPGQMLVCDNATLHPHAIVCDGMSDCEDLLDERFCRHSNGKEIMRCSSLSKHDDYFKLAIACDGRPECDDFSDECGEECPDSFNICTMQARNLNCSFQGQNRSFSARNICDGTQANCMNSFDDEENCLNRFYCASENNELISIDSMHVCDGVAHCLDKSDEANCSARFHCASGLQLSVPLSHVMDGVDDCHDGSDECPPYLDLQLYSSRFELISRLPITIWLWVMAIVGVIGNVTVFTYTLLRLIDQNLSSPIARVNYILILNLNVADFLMSVYLLFIGAKIAEYSGSYCHVDLAWRTSFACNFMGTFAMFSAEASLLMLVLMTSYRLYTIYSPFDNRSRVNYVVAGIITVWSFSALIAVMPFMLPHIFVERYWIESKYFNNALVRLPAFDAFFRKLVFITQPANTTALKPGFDFEGFLINNYPQFAIMGKIDYYNENGVCIPHFYVPLEDNGSFYPTIIVTINMIAFIYVGIAYYKVLRLSVRSKRRTNQRTHSSVRLLQKRIAKLVVVNFVIWFPVCVASYIQLGIEMEFSGALYVITGIVLFPINSVINPLLYSDVFEKVYRKLRKLLKSCKKAKPETRQTSDITNKQTSSNVKPFMTTAVDLTSPAST